MNRRRRTIALALILHTLVVVSVSGKPREVRDLPDKATQKDEKDMKPFVEVLLLYVLVLAYCYNNINK